MRRILVVGCGIPIKAMALVLFPFPVYAATIPFPRELSTFVRDETLGLELPSPVTRPVEERTARVGVTSPSNTNAY